MALYRSLGTIDRVLLASASIGVWGTVRVLAVDVHQCVFGGGRGRELGGVFSGVFHVVDIQSNK